MALTNPALGWRQIAQIESRITASNGMSAYYSARICVLP